MRDDAEHDGGDREHPRAALAVLQPGREDEHRAGGEHGRCEDRSVDHSVEGARLQPGAPLRMQDVEHGEHRREAHDERDEPWHPGTPLRALSAECLDGSGHPRRGHHGPDSTAEPRRPVRDPWQENWQDAGMNRGREDTTAPSGSRVVARADDGIAELALLRRATAHGEVLELVVDGVFAMDTEQTETERALASLALEQLGGDQLHVVVGGLGLGYTTATLLADERVRRVDVVELHAPLVQWLREGRVPAVRGLLDDPRVHVTVA